MNLDFGEVFRRMWKIGWNNKVLWGYQMLPGLLSIFIMPLILLTNPAFALFLPEPWNQLAEEPWLMGLYMLLFFIFFILVMFVGTVAQLATTHGALKVDQGAQKLAFRETLSESLHFFWRVVGLYTIFGGAWMLIVFAFMAVNIAGSMLTFGLASLCLMPLFFLFIPVVIVGYAVLELAQAAIIAENRKVMDAISHAWKLFRANILAVILLMVILYFGLSMISSLFVFPMMLPMMFFPLGFESDGNFDHTFVMFFLVFFPLMFVLLSIVQGILMAFFQSAWAVAYLRLNRKPDPAMDVLPAS